MSLSESERAAIRAQVEARLAEVGLLEPPSPPPPAVPGRSPWRRHPVPTEPAVGELGEGDRTLWVPPMDREPEPAPVVEHVPAVDVDVLPATSPRARQRAQAAEVAFVRRWERLTGHRAPRGSRGRVT